MPLRIRYSDAPSICDLWRLYAIAINPHVHFGEIDLPDSEMAALRAILEEYMESAIEITEPFLVFLERLEET
jgi:hypothetical protein